MILYKTMENIDSSITKIYEKQQTTSGTEEEALEYLQVLERHSDLNAIIGENTDTPIKISSKSWDTIVRLIPEEKKYSLAFICFSLVNEIEENEIWGIKKNPETGEETVLKDVFFNTLLEASTPHDVPFVMCEDDFSIFTDYFNQKEKEAKNRKIKLSEDLALGAENVEDTGKDLEKEEEKEKEKEEEKENEGYEIKTEVIEDKNGVKRLVTTKTTTSHTTVIQPKYDSKDEKQKEKIIKIEPKQEKIRSKIKPKEERDKKEKKMDVVVSLFSLFSFIVSILAISSFFGSSFSIISFLGSSFSVSSFFESSISLSSFFGCSFSLSSFSDILFFL